MSLINNEGLILTAHSYKNRNVADEKIKKEKSSLTFVLFFRTFSM